ncbi:MAG TPA: type I DNA topoisomerase [Thermoanaerobaculia bacterium]|nr:type I DNA topoisomerase [Thermoanaerobaculia bacterium]
MAKNLVIVESPAKAKTINKFVGKDYIVKASVGHVRDLPKSELGVDEVTFEPRYEVLEGKEKVVSELRAAAKKADIIYIASDPDREGEAIGWHVMHLLGGDSKKVRRILFHEITRNAVRKAIEQPLEIDMNKVNAQQARRVLDRLVGYKLSPLLWDKVRRGLSAGRVQSVAMKMIVDREEEIKAFVPEEYWTFAAKLEAPAPPPFIARLSKVDGKKAEVPNEETARAIEATLESGQYRVAAVARKEKKQSPAPPFITSTLQRTAYNRFKYPVKRTMQIAQKLYEGKELGSDGLVGLITYMRTDSVRISEDALAEVRGYISTKYGADILPETPNYYRVKKAAQAQDAHEAVRPTAVEFDPERVKDYLTKEEYNIYELIFDRFVASQMKPALFDVTDVDIERANLTLRASGEVLKFAGFLAAFQDVATDDEEGEEKKDDKALPPMSEDDILKLLDLETKQNFTQPPPRFTEATLVKALEENGIGRPSTYGQILTTIQARDYTYKHDGKFHPTQLGMLVTRLLKESFADIIDESYTASLELELDEIEEGKLDWTKAIQKFAKKFNKDLTRAEKEMTSIKGSGIETEEKCENCGAPMIIKFGRFGEFLACSNYPECKTTKEIAKGDAVGADEETIVCEKCGRNMVLKRSRFGQFFACTGYPDCRNTKDPKLMKANIPQEPQPPCEHCGKEMVLKSGRYGPFYSCSGYPDCRNIRKIGGGKSVPPKPTGVKCPTCGEGELVERRSRRGIFYSCSRYPKCDFALNSRPVPRPCPKCAALYLLEKETKREGHIEYCNNSDCDYRQPIPKPDAASGE